MPPYTPNRSRAQQRKLFVLADQGKVSMDDAKGKARVSHYASLPEHIRTAAVKGLTYATRRR
jgi:uncharacterized protein YjhX (UPF0386 family)